MQVEVEKIRVRKGRRSVDASYVKELSESIRELGLLNPVTVDKDCCLIAGLHRLEAVKMLGLSSVECTVSSLEGLQAELAEIDENIVRNGLTALEYGEILLRRKEIYEILHPESKATYEGGGFKGNQYRKVEADKMAATTKSFVEDTAEKLGVAPRTVRRGIQAARNLSPEAKKIIKDTGTKLIQKEAVKLSRMEPERQKEAALLLSEGKIHSVGEYAPKAAGEETPDKKGTQGRKEAECEMPGMGITVDTAEKLPEEAPKEARMERKDSGQAERGKARDKDALKPVTRKDGNRAIKEVVADLKNTDKDYGSTPDSFLAEYAAFVRKFHKEIAWYGSPYYEEVFPQMDSRQLAFFREQTDSICAAAEGLFHKAERTVER